MANPFDFRVLTKAVRQIVTPGQHFIEAFFQGQPEYHNVRLIEVHIKRDGRDMAAFVEPLHAGHVSDRASFMAGSVKIPYLKEKRPLSVQDLLQTQPGQHVYDVVDPKRQANAVIGDDLRDLRNRIARREEWMAARGIIDAVVEVKGDGIDAKITYPTLAEHRPTLTGDDRWGQDASDPIEQQREFGRLIQLATGKPMTDAFFGFDVVDRWLKHTKVRAYFDIRNIDIGAVNLRREKAQPGQKIHIASVEGCDIWEIREWYKDDAGVVQPSVPTKAAVFGSRYADNRRHYGLIEDMDAITEAPRTVRSDFYAKSWVEKDPSVRWMLVQSAPLPIPHEIDGFVVVKDVFNV